MRIVWGFLIMLVVCAGAKFLVPEARAAAPVTVSFTEVGSHSFTVPAGVTSIHVVAIGAPGGSRVTPGGLGAVATADVAVTSGQSLAVYVGGEGAATAGSGFSPGGFNGGGNSSEYGAGGGGASDVRSGVGTDLASRLVVAGGGGGGADNAAQGSDDPTAGGAAGENGGSNSECGGGGAATTSKGGAGGKGSSPGGAGSLGQGGSSGSSGGGGGGGLYGGGAGGFYLNDGLELATPCGGGGGSSGFGAGTSATSVTVSQTRTPSVTISYVASTATPTPTPTPPPTGPGQAAQTTKASVSLPGVQHGKAVVATVRIAANRSSLRAKLFSKATKSGGGKGTVAAKKLLVGSLTEAPLKKGLHSFTVKLNKKGKKALEKLGTLKLTLQVAVTPPTGAAATATKSVKLKP